MGITAVPNEHVLRLSLFVESDCKYLRAVPEPTPNEEGTRDM